MRRHKLAFEIDVRRTGESLRLTQNDPEFSFTKQGFTRRSKHLPCGLEDLQVPCHTKLSLDHRDDTQPGVAQVRVARELQQYQCRPVKLHRDISYHLSLEEQGLRRPPEQRRLDHRQRKRRDMQRPRGKHLAYSQPQVLTVLQSPKKWLEDVDRLELTWRSADRGVGGRRRPVQASGRRDSRSRRQTA